MNDVLSCVTVHGSYRVTHYPVTYWLLFISVRAILFWLLGDQFWHCSWKNDRNSNPDAPVSALRRANQTGLLAGCNQHESGGRQAATSEREGRHRSWLLHRTRPTHSPLSLDRRWRDGGSRQMWDIYSRTFDPGHPPRKLPSRIYAPTYLTLSLTLNPNHNANSVFNIPTLTPNTNRNS